MKAPDLCLAVYMGYCYAESIPIVRIIRRCGFTNMIYGSQLTSDELYDMGYFWSTDHFLSLNLNTKLVCAVSKNYISGYRFLVDIEDLKKSISYKRLDGGRGKGPGHFEASTFFNMPKYQNIQSKYLDWCEDWYERRTKEAIHIREEVNL